jgi:glyoxylase-like metal-dependent hydrolase (beta-lactamase superfamily II)
MGPGFSTFPNARYVVQKAHYEYALHPTERDHASFAADNYVPLMNAGQMTLLDGDAEIVPGVEVTPLTGHTIAMQCVKLTGGGKTAFVLADLVPTGVHLPLPWIMGFDMYPMSTLESKKKWLPIIVRESWLALFAHDATMPAAYIREKDGRWEAEPVEVD